MADGDNLLGAGGTLPGGTQLDPNAEDPSAGNADQPEPEHVQPGVTGDDNSDKEIMSRAAESTRVVNQLLTSIQKRNDEADKFAAGLQPELDALKKGISDLGNVQPPPIPQPPQYTQEQKGNVSQGWLGLVKVAALMGLAFGMRGRGAYHNAIFKQALGAFMGAYAKGMDKQAEDARALYEKNWQLYKEYATEQNQRYKDLIADKRLELSQKMDVWKAEATAAGAKRDADAGERKDLLAAVTATTDQMRLLKEMSQQKRESEKTLLQGLGKDDNMRGYLSAVLQKPGGAELLSKLDTPQGEFEVFKRYPFRDYIDEKQAQDAKAKREAEEAEAPAKEKQELDLNRKKELQKKAIGEGKDPDYYINQPSTPDKNTPPTKADNDKMMRDLGIGPSPTPSESESD